MYVMERPGNTVSKESGGEEQGDPLGGQTDTGAHTCMVVTCDPVKAHLVLFVWLVRTDLITI